MKFAIIENEYGDINIDSDLVTMQEESKEEIIEMINGCICCNVRGDLIPLVKKLLAQKDQFDGILIETTGMADPSPVIQTFFLDSEISKQVEVNGLVTVVDTKHVVQHLQETKEEHAINETERQIAYADKILLNKIDLVDATTKAHSWNEIRKLNKTAEIIETEMSIVDPKRLIGIKGFDLERVLEDKCIDPEPDPIVQKTCKKGCCSNKTSNDGCKSEACKSKTKHDSRISSISLKFDGEMQIKKLQVELNKLIRLKSEKLYRYKGVLAVKGMNEKFVFQGVHMLLSGSFIPNSRWDDEEKRHSKFVFIGIDLDREELRELFESCRAQPLRFKVGTLVEVNAGVWSKGTIIKLWDKGNPYRIRFDNGREAWCPEDTDNFCRKRAKK